MNASVETPVKPSKGRRMLNLLKGLTKVGFACAVLVMMVDLTHHLRDIRSTAYQTDRKFDGLSKLLTDLFEPSAEKTDAAPVVSLFFYW